MPRVKIDYVVSCSSEDPEHPADNLLAQEISNKKWLCAKGESSCSVVLQLARAVEISSINIGSHHSALIEVLVGLSEKPNDAFQVLVPSCVFVPFVQSRYEQNISRVRTFCGDELAASVRAGRYDRVRVVCSQPYNKQCQFGLSFIHILEPEFAAAAAPTVPAAVPSRLIAVDNFSSDDEEFRPGELYAKHRQSTGGSDKPATSNTDAQIRQATSQALKNISDSATKLVKTTIGKPGNNQQKQATEDVPANRQRDNLIYTNDDAKPHDKIDRVVNRHKDEKTADGVVNKPNTVDTAEKENNNTGTSDNAKKNKDSDDKNMKANTLNQSKEKNQKKNVPVSSPRKRKHDYNRFEEVGPVCEDITLVLRGVTVALSGYQGARRASLREKALALGARYSPDWGPRCTHLICAFPFTPKMLAAKASGADVPIATAEWLDSCTAHRRRLPWRWYATESEKRMRRTVPALLEEQEDHDTGDGTAAALSKAHLRKIRRVEVEPEPEPAVDAAPADVDTSELERGLSDVSFARDGRASPDSSGALTDAGEAPPADEEIDVGKALPNFFDGYTFVISDDVGEKKDRDLLTRYVRAFGGLVIQESEVGADSEVHYVVCAGAVGGAVGGETEVAAGEEAGGVAGGVAEGAARGEAGGVAEDGAGGKARGAARVTPAWVRLCARERRLCALDA